MSAPTFNLRYLHHSVLGLVLWENPPDAPGTFQHHHMANALLEEFPKSTITSAGYVGVSRGEIVCHGDSMSLDLKCAPADTMRLQRAIGVSANASKPYRVSGAVDEPPAPVARTGEHNGGPYDTGT